MTSKLSDTAQRVEWVLKKVWSGSQTKMAAEIGVSQSAISNVVTGRQQPGRKFLAAVASKSLINSTWLITGEGDPLITQGPESSRRALYVARTLFDGYPEDHGDQLGNMLEVPMRFYRSSRYWIEVQTGCPLTKFDSLKIAVGDFVLFEPDAKNWPANLVGHPCIVRTQHGDLQFDCVVNQHHDTITTSGANSIKTEMPMDGKYLRGFSFVNDDNTPTPKPKNPACIPVAIGIFRMGGFGSP